MPVHRNRVSRVQGRDSLLRANLLRLKAGVGSVRSRHLAAMPVQRNRVLRVHGRSLVRGSNRLRRRAAADTVRSRHLVAMPVQRSRASRVHGRRLVRGGNRLRRRAVADTVRLRHPVAMPVQRNRALRVHGRSCPGLNLPRLKAGADTVRSISRRAVKLRVANRARILPAAAAAVIGIALPQVRAGNVATAGTPMAPDIVRPVHSSICASRLHVRRTAGDIRVAAQAGMAATVLHRQAMVDRTEHQAMVVLVEQPVPAAEDVATAAAAVVMLLVVDIRAVAEVDTPAAGVGTQAAAGVDIPVAAAIPAVIAKTAR
jgi:hypothetical protein